MTLFFRVASDEDKQSTLAEKCGLYRDGEVGIREIFEVSSSTFADIPGSPFAYWASPKVVDIFRSLPTYGRSGRVVRTTNPTTDDFRFARLWWEPNNFKGIRWRSWNKGGGFSPYYRDIETVVRWDEQRDTYLGYVGTIYRPDIRPANLEYFSRPGLSWGYRGSRFCIQAMPSGTVISTRGNGIYADSSLLCVDLGLMNSCVPDFLIKLTLGRNDHPQFDIGDVNGIPLPLVSDQAGDRLASLARHAWQIRRKLDTVTEISHAFLLPLALRQAKFEHLGLFDPSAIDDEITRIQAEIDNIAFALYGFSNADRAAALGAVSGEARDDADVDGDEDEAAPDIPSADALLSWAIGVAFGRFDIRLATGERVAPPEPEPFDPLPAKSPGMLPDGDAPFHAHAGILVDDPGHAHDLVRITERVLERVDMPVPADMQRWLQKDFFPFHLQRYSKSRRKAPIYWPLATASGSYTLWLYYPSLTSQTLYTAINDFVEPKLVDVVKEAAGLKTKGSARNREEERRLEALTTLEAELTDLRDQLQAIAPQYRPNHDDGVQITAAPLWPLFRHKPWQKLLKDTWAKLQKGDYDWANLAMNYWPERVREKCKTDKSLAIAHGLEDLYAEPEAAPKKARGRKKKEDAE